MSRDVASPCIGVCRMNPASGCCDGCLRTLDEIASWTQLDNDARQRVWLLIAERRASLRGAKPAAP